MTPKEYFVSPKSEHYFYFPSLTAKETFFYPICTGHHIYLKGYSLRRNSYDSFLVMFIQSGSLTVEYEDQSENATQGQFVLLDCYAPHAYYSDVGWECIWCHFDGPLARKYYELVTATMGHVFTLTNPYPVFERLNSVLRMFAGGTFLSEPLISQYLTDVLTAFITESSKGSLSFEDSSAAQRAVSYISEHFAEPVSTQMLAKYTSLSQYHFIRVFKKETGFTPYEYLLNTRISAAKYYLRYTELTIKNICFSTGFSNVSVFCTTFKKNTGLTPGEFRTANLPPDPA